MIQHYTTNPDGIDFPPLSGYKLLYVQFVPSIFVCALMLTLYTDNIENYDDKKLFPMNDYNMVN